MTGITLPLAILAGIAAFASPCCLPLVPAYVSYMLGGPGLERSRGFAFRQALAFVAGFSTVFVTLWASVGLIGYVLRDYSGLLRIIGGAVLIVMGLHVAGLIEISALYREIRVPVTTLVGAATGARRTQQAARPAEAGQLTAQGGPAASESKRGPTYRRSALLGVAFAAGWTPCVGPILGGIIGLASVSSSVAAGTTLLVAFSLGLGIPFILVAVGATEVNRHFGWLRRHHEAISLVTGALLVLIGFLMVANLFGRLSGLIPSFAI